MGWAIRIECHGVVSSDRRATPGAKADGQLPPVAPWAALVVLVVDGVAAHVVEVVDFDDVLPAFATAVVGVLVAEVLVTVTVLVVDPSPWVTIRPPVMLTKPAMLATAVRRRARAAAWRRGRRVSPAQSAEPIWGEEETSGSLDMNPGWGAKVRGT